MNSSKRLKLAQNAYAAAHLDDDGGAWIVWLFVCSLIACIGICVYAAPVFMTVVLGAVIGWSAVADVMQKRRLSRLVAQRPDDSICTFARSFDRRAVDPLIIRSVYEAVQRNVHSEHQPFPVSQRCYFI